MRALLLVALASLLTGCGKCPNRAEASRVLHTFDKLIAAPNEKKAEPLAELQDAPCSAPLICDARDKCTAAFGHLVEGMRTEKVVKEAIAEMEQEGGSRARIDALEAELDRAERELNLAKAAIPECERAASDLRRTCGG